MRLALVLVPIILAMKVALGAEQPSWFPDQACQKSHLQKNEKEDRKKCHKEWTVLIFMEADNDLSPYSYWDLYEMERKMKSYPHGASSISSDVIVEWDNEDPTGIKRLHLQESDKEYDHNVDLDFFKQADESLINSPIIQIIGERDFPIAERFENFIRWGIKAYPAKQYMVVVWGHGEGYIGSNPTANNEPSTLFPVPAENNSLFLGEEDLELNFDYDIPLSTFPVAKPFGGVALDYSELEYLGMKVIAKSLKRIKEEILEGKNIDMLTFDACLMQSLEVAMEVRDSVEFLVGSDQIQNYLGLPYKMLLSRINKVKPTPYELAREIPDIVTKSFSKGGYQGNVDPEGLRTFTVSSLNLQEMDLVLVPSLFDFSKAVVDYLDEKPFRKLELGFILQKTPSFQGEGRDLGILMGSILMLIHREAEKEGLSPKAQRLREAAEDVFYAIGRSTMNYAYGTMYYRPQDSQNKNYLLGFFKGLSAWVPKSPNTYKARKSEFSESALFKIESGGVRWDDWLNKVYSITLPF